MDQHSDYSAVDQHGTDVRIEPQRAIQKKLASCHRICFRIMWACIILFSLTTISVGIGVYYLLHHYDFRFPGSPRYISVNFCLSANSRSTRREAGLFLETLLAERFPDKNLPVPTHAIKTDLSQLEDYLYCNAHFETLDNTLTFDIRLSTDKNIFGYSKESIVVASGSAAFSPEESVITVNVHKSKRALFLLRLMLLFLGVPSHRSFKDLEFRRNRWFLDKRGVQRCVLNGQHNLLVYLPDDPALRRITSITLEPSQIVVKACRSSICASSGESAAVSVECEETFKSRFRRILRSLLMVDVVAVLV